MLKNLLNCPSKTETSTACIVDGKLVLSLLGAEKPIVWQMDMGQVKASALEVNQNEEKEVWDLVLKTPKGEHLEIAPFATKEDAVHALAAASKALKNAHGRIRPVSVINAEGSDSVPHSGKVKKRKGWVAPVLGILLLIVLITVWRSLAPLPAGSLEQVNVSGPQSGGESQAGVPLSADDFLRSQ